MKKKIGITVGMIAMLMFGLVGGAYGAVWYIEWAGSNDYRQTLINLDLITDRGNELQTDKQNLIAEKQTLLTEYEQLVSEHENTYRENEQLNNTIKDKENQINSLEQQIEALEKRIADGQTTRDMHEQATKDMKHVKEKANEVLEGMQNE